MLKKKMQTQKQVIKTGKAEFPAFSDRTEERDKAQHMRAEVVRMVIMTSLRATLCGWLLSRVMGLQMW